MLQQPQDSHQHRNIITQHIQMLYKKFVIIVQVMIVKMIYIIKDLQQVDLQVI